MPVIISLPGFVRSQSGSREENGRPESIFRRNSLNFYFETRPPDNLDFLPPWRKGLD